MLITNTLLFTWLLTLLPACSIFPLSSYCLVLCVVFKVGWVVTFLKWLESSNLLQMSALTYIFSPTDIIAGDILIGWGHSQPVFLCQAWGKKLQDPLGWELLPAWVCFLWNYWTLVWRFLRVWFTLLPACFLAFGFPHGCFCTIRKRAVQFTPLGGCVLFVREGESSLTLICSWRCCAILVSEWAGVAHLLTPKLKNSGNRV